MATKLSLLLLLVIFICSHSEGSKLRTTTMTLYFQDWSAGPNATVIPITGLPGRLWSFFSFGTIFCTDDPITEGLDKASLEIARAQGIYVTSALDGSNTHVLISIVFTNNKYNGSTLEVQGASHQIDNVREVSVVAGTGKFRYARGYATFEMCLEHLYRTLVCLNEWFTTNNEMIYPFSLRIVIEVSLIILFGPVLPLRFLKY